MKVLSFPDGISYLKLKWSGGSVRVPKCFTYCAEVILSPDGLCLFDSKSWMTVVSESRFEVNYKWQMLLHDCWVLWDSRENMLSGSGGFFRWGYVSRDVSRGVCQCLLFCQMLKTISSRQRVGQHSFLSCGQFHTAVFFTQRRVNLTMGILGKRG